MFLLYAGLTQPVQSATSGRWFNPQQVSQGKSLFQQHCAVCHGANAEGTADWKQTDANGNYPPPPLNGSAHAWHHDLPLLQRTVREGGQKLGGQMPPFEQILNATEIDSVIAYFQSQWPDEIYQKWAGRFEPANDLPSIDDIARLLEKKPELRYLQQRLQGVEIGTPLLSPVKQLYQIQFNDKYLYLTEDGEYAIIGEMIDLKKGVNLSKQK